MDDSARIKRVISEIGGSKTKAFRIDDKASAVFMEHALEVTKAVVEGSLAVANHKGGSALEVEDVTLFLGNFISCIVLVTKNFCELPQICYNLHSD